MKPRKKLRLYHSYIQAQIQKNLLCIAELAEHLCLKDKKVCDIFSINLGKSQTYILTLYTTLCLASKGFLLIACLLPGKFFSRDFIEKNTDCQ